MGYTTDKNDPCLKAGRKEEGQNNCYLILTEEERQKGFVRPYRESYVHKGTKIERDEEGRIIGKLIKIDEDEYPNNDHFTKEKGFGGYIKYPKGHHCHGRYITVKEVNAIVNGKSHFGGCETLTIMGRALAETYARNNKFYSETFCCGCNKHLPVSEFVWSEDGETVGS